MYPQPGLYRSENFGNNCCEDNVVFVVPANPLREERQRVSFYRGKGLVIIQVDQTTWDRSQMVPVTTLEDVPEGLRERAALLLSGEDED